VDNHRTHEVSNQVPPLQDYNAYGCDPTLAEAVGSSGAGWAEAELSALGASVGAAAWQAEARASNLNPPRLLTHDRYGRRVDAVEYHPSYHKLMGLSLGSGAHSFAWQHAGRAGAATARATLMYLMYQLECGVCCPTTMTFAAPPALEAAATPLVSQAWLPGLSARSYDPRDVPLGEKSGLTIGMSMTEKQGGSDVRANTTRATPVRGGAAGPGDQFTLVGHKWFTSAPMSDGFLTLANTDEGVSCFLVPRWLPDGTRNSGLRLQRLKDKLGDRANASSEIEYENAWGVMVGPAGRGVRTIVEMVVHTRLDCTIGSAALMRQSAQLASHHAAHRGAFGRTLGDAPLMRAVLLDLAVETEAANGTWARLARSFELAGESAPEAALRRIATAVGKYWVCKRAPGVAYEAMECHGGNGYVEESPTARLFRQSPLNAIWEGSGSVICLDILRALKTEPESGVAFVAELTRARGADARLDALARELADEIGAISAERGGGGGGGGGGGEGGARLLVDKMALALQASCLLQHGNASAAEAYCASRLPGPGGRSGGWNYGATRGDFGAAPAESELLDRLSPAARPGAA
jgi:putative acyl-CoA dehydrogenase